MCNLLEHVSVQIYFSFLHFAKTRSRWNNCNHRGVPVLTPSHKGLQSLMTWIFPNYQLQFVACLLAGWAPTWMPRFLPVRFENYTRIVSYLNIFIYIQATFFPFIPSMFSYLFEKWARGHTHTHTHTHTHMYINKLSPWVWWIVSLMKITFIYTYTHHKHIYIHTTYILYVHKQYIHVHLYIHTYIQDRKSVV